VKVRGCVLVDPARCYRRGKVHNGGTGCYVRKSKRITTLCNRLRTVERGEEAGISELSL